MINLDTQALTTPTVAIVLNRDAKVTQKQRAIGICMATEYIDSSRPPDVGQGVFAPNSTARSYFALFENRIVPYPPSRAIQLVKGPEHGTVTPYLNPGDGIQSWRYLPNRGFVGPGNMEFIVEADGVPVRVVYYFKVNKLNIEDGSAEKLCRKFEWKISSTDPQDQTDFTQWQATANLTEMRSILARVP